jgi:hypothetical protein
MEAFVAILLVSVLVGGIVAAATAASKQAMRSRLERIAEAVGGHIEDGARVVSSPGGITTRYAFITIGAGSSAESWTAVSAELPRGYPLQLRVDRGGPRPDLVERGILVDLELGDPEFDREFVVEAAPSDVVRHLLDPAARALLVERVGARLTTVDDGDRRCVMYSFPGWDEAPGTAQRLTAELARLAGRVREAYAAAEAEAGLVDVGSPFRPQLDDAPARAAAEVRTRELEQVAAVQERRKERERTVSVAVIVGVMVFVVVMAAGAATCAQ